MQRVEALLRLQGKGEVYLRGSWVEIEAGDVAFFPAAVKHAVRSPHHNQRDFVLVTQICPPSSISMSQLATTTGPVV